MSIESEDILLNTPFLKSPERPKLDNIAWFELSGQTLSQLERGGKLFRHGVPEDIKDMGSIQGLVGIDLEHKFLKSTNWPRDHVLPRIAWDNYENAVDDVALGLTVFRGTIADYAELAFMHYELTGERLFSGKYAKTTTPDMSGMLGNRFYEIGDSISPQNHKYEVDIKSWFANGRSENSFTFPLLVLATPNTEYLS